MPKLFEKNLAKFIAIAAVSLLLVFFNPKLVFNPVREVFFKLAYPFQKTFFVVSRSLRGTADFLSSIGQLHAENERLIRENNSLSTRIGSLTEAQKENNTLREQINLVPKEKFQLEGAFVLSQDSQGLGSWIMIDKGRGVGVAVGMPVIVSDGILIGKIDAVYQDSAKVSLLADSQSVVNAVDVESDAKGVVKGEYGLGLTLDMVSQADALSVGDTVVTSGLGGDLPKGLAIGKIQEVRSTQDKLFQQAVIFPRVKYSKLDLVFVVKK